MKKLENEYRQLMQNETPDLWSRIEAGIDAKIAADNVTNSDTDEIENVVEFAEKKSSGKVKAGANLWKKYSLPLVACIAAILCIPLLLTGFLRMASGGKAESEAMITELADDYAAADCAAPEEATSVNMDTTAVVTEESCDEEVDDALVENVEEYSATKSDDCVAETESTSEDSKQSAEELTGLPQVLTVIQISQGFEESEENCENGVIYHLTTEEAGECTLFVPADATFEFDMGIQLKIQVEPGNEAYDFVFVEIAE